MFYNKTKGYIVNKEKHPFTILYVEDEKSIRDNYIKYLNNYYENVYGAQSGEEAYEIYLNIKPQIMIIDINLPQMNGIELLSKIREHDHTTRAIMLTAHTETNFLLQAIELKLTQYLIKPIKRAKLKESLELALNELSKFEVSNKELINLKENFIYDMANKELLNNGRVVELTKKESKLLDLLIQKQNKASTYEELIYKIWDDDFSDKSASLRTIIKTIRKKLPKNCIKNISAIGYKVEF